MKDWTRQRVVIIGAARQGMALGRYLAQHGAMVVLTDRRPLGELLAAQDTLADLPVKWVCGGHPLTLLDGADLVCVSGGVPLSLPLIVEARARGISISNDSQIFLEEAPCRVIGITGSSGKTTTTALVGRIAQEAIDGYWTRASDGNRILPTFKIQPLARVWVGGNIGSPLIAVVDEMRPDDLAVMELSSFQLEIMTRSPQVAAVLNVTPNHLDRHGTMQAYTAVKARILENQSPADVAVLGWDDPVAWSLANKIRGRLVVFGLGELGQQPGTFLRDGDVFLGNGESQVGLIHRRKIALRGEHNLLNVLAACAIAAAAGLPVEAMQVGVEGFEGVPHRLEFVRSRGGSDWYNDSIATAPERAMAAIRSFDEPIVLLAGGRDKDLPWEDFTALVQRRVKHLIVFGEAAEKIAAAIEETGLPGSSFPMMHCSGMRDAVKAAAKVVQPGDVVLLSPGGTSFDEFHDFEERGECFRQLVMQL